jgi:GNAT superfamily N-acetyltransferase
MHCCIQSLIIYPYIYRVSTLFNTAMDINYRQAVREDCPAISALVNIASGGALEFMLHDLVPDLTPAVMISNVLSGDSGHYTFRNAIIAADGDIAIGIAMSFPARFHVVSEEMRNFVPADRLEHMREFFSFRIEDSLFLDALCVQDGYRNQGIGSHLISLVKDKAADAGFNKLSVAVFLDNAAGLRLYERHGFRRVKTVGLKPHALIPHEGGIIFLECELA